MSTRITIVGTSHIRRLMSDINKHTDAVFEPGFGIAEASICVICGGGWTIDSVRSKFPLIVQSQPDYVILKVGSNDLCGVCLADSLSVANRLLATASELCSLCEARGVIVCELTKRGLGRYLQSMWEVKTYNHKVDLANQFLHTVIPLEPVKLLLWKHKGMSDSVEHLLLPDGVHMNAHGQFKLHKSLWGAVIFVAKGSWNL